MLQRMDSRYVWVQQLCQVVKALVDGNVVRHPATPVANMAHVIWGTSQQQQGRQRQQRQ
jgi:hypothetical protein